MLFATSKAATVCSSGFIADCLSCTDKNENLRYILRNTTADTTRRCTKVHSQNAKKKKKKKAIKNKRQKNKDSR